MNRFVDPYQVKTAVYHHATDRQMPRERHVTILRGSLGEAETLSDTLEPEDLQVIMSTFLSFASDAVRETRGIMLEVNGAELSAVWNALPEDDQEEEHAARACRAALLIERGAEVVSSALGEGMPHTCFHGGIVSGVVNVGPIGTNGRLRWSCVGVPASEASRLHELSRTWRVGTLFAHATLDALHGQDILKRTVDVYATEDGSVMPVYELWADVLEDTAREDQALAGLYDQGFQAYMSHDMIAARTCMQDYLGARPGDIPAMLHVERARNIEEQADRVA